MDVNCVRKENCIVEKYIPTYNTPTKNGCDNVAFLYACTYYVFDK